jgi:hypothetical protein
VLNSVRVRRGGGGEGGRILFNTSGYQSLLTVDSVHCAVSQIRRVSPKIKIHHSDLSMHKSIKTVRQVEQIFEPYCVMFKELKGKKKKQLTSQ